jgi:predicted DNA-binding protein (UPF0251 family)/DNA-directed RNA polymerase subunit RPC12/RpoP
MGLIRLARPTKWRKIDNFPAVQNFVPSEADVSGYVENILKIEELEAIRLKDLEGMEQEECANNMQVSRPTFQRILISAREKIADSLINGKAIRIEGGNFTRNICAVKCLDCGKEWAESYENLEKIKNEEYTCPNCNSKKVICEQHQKGKFCNGKCWRHGRNNDQH